MSDGNNGNKVWVKWFDGKLNGMDEVKGLAEGACIRDLLEAFVNQQNYQTTSPGTLSIFESEAATEPLRRNISLKDYFECFPPNGPGTDYDAPLVVKFQLAPVAVVPAPSVMDIAEVNALLDELMKSWDVQARTLSNSGRCCSVPIPQDRYQRHRTHSFFTQWIDSFASSA